MWTLLKIAGYTNDCLRVTGASRRFLAQKSGIANYKPEQNQAVDCFATWR